ncbi:MAG: hypothetical protein WCC36_00680 [Gammaproteobacteria bacterium]
MSSREGFAQLVAGVAHGLKHVHASQDDVARPFNGVDHKRDAVPEHLLTEAQQWYFDARLPSFGNLTPDQLVRKGQWRFVLRHIRRVESGGYV